MNIMRIALIVIAIVVVAGAAVAQTPPPPNAGAFDRLSPGNQKIAQALFAAQLRSNAPPAARLSLDDIAALKLNGRGWGNVYKTMYTRGLVTEKNLGQVVRASNKALHASSSSTTIITTGSGRTVVVGHASSSSGKSTNFGKGNGASDGGGSSVSSSVSSAGSSSGNGNSGGGGNSGGHAFGRSK
jgi:hypothetical protein